MKPAALLPSPDQAVLPIEKSSDVEYIVSCQAHPALVKKGESDVRFVPFNFFLSKWVHLWTDQRVPGRCLVAARSQGSLSETLPR